MSVYSNYSLVRGTLDFCRRIKRENPVLWAQIQAEAAQAEAAQAERQKEVAADGIQAVPR